MPEITVTLEVADEIFEQLEAIARRRNISLSDVVNEILEAYFKDRVEAAADDEEGKQHE